MMMMNENSQEVISTVEESHIDVNDDSGDNDEQQQQRQEEEVVPIELQLEQVDMDDPMMDPLEWAVRKVIPIPKAYFWETGNHDLPAKTKMWHRAVGAMSRLVHFMDNSVGKPVADTIGINSSRFDYVTSTMTEKQWEEAKRIASERKLHSQTGRSTRNIVFQQEDDQEDGYAEIIQQTSTEGSSETLQNVHQGEAKVEEDEADIEEPSTIQISEKGEWV